MKSDSLIARRLARLDALTSRAAVRFGVWLFGLLIALAAFYEILVWVIVPAAGDSGLSTYGILGNSLGSPVIGLIALSGLGAALALGLSARPRVLRVPDSTSRAAPSPQNLPETAPAADSLAAPAMDPELEQLLEELADRNTEPPRRLAIGDCLAELGDPRAGVGLRADGLPDIAWVTIRGTSFVYGERGTAERRKTGTFQIARYPVTNAQFQAFVGAGGYDDPRWWEGRASPKHAPARWLQPNRPRGTVNWFEAMAFCRWLTTALQRPVRLPTENEWERAARGTDGRQFPWGDDYHAGYANVDEAEKSDGPWHLAQTVAVGAYPQNASPEGVMDMAGQVWEWCIDIHDANASLSTEDDNAARVLRGGSWFSRPALARSAVRYWVLPVFRDVDIGFRVVCSAPSLHSDH